MGITGAEIFPIYEMAPFRVLSLYSHSHWLKWKWPSPPRIHPTREPVFYRLLSVLRRRRQLLLVGWNYLSQMSLPSSRPRRPVHEMRRGRNVSLLWETTMKFESAPGKVISYQNGDPFWFRYSRVESRKNHYLCSYFNNERLSEPNVISTYLGS